MKTPLHKLMNITKAFLIEALLLCLFAGSVFAQELPVTGLVPFQTEELTVNKGIVQRIEFTRSKMNITLKNTTSSRQDVDIHVYVLNKDGVIIFKMNEKWMLDTLDVDAKFAKDYDFSPSVPEALQFSIYAKDFDLTPKWILFR